MAINIWFFCIYNKVFNEIAVQRYEIIRNSDRLPALFFLAAYTMCPHFLRLFGQESGAIWQYPSTGNEHQVGKDYTPEEQAWNRLATYVNAAQALDKECSLWKMIDEMSDIRSQMERISKDEARSRIINACLHPILSHGGDRYFNSISPPLKPFKNY